MSASASSSQADLLAELTALVGSEQEARWILEDVPDPTAARALAERRRAGEPLQHLLGHWGFRTLDVLCDRRALIPRPETELLTTTALSLLRERLASPPGPLCVADLGTGSGVIACSIAVEFGAGVRVIATDRSGDALSLAAENVRRLCAGPGSGSVELREGSWFEALPAELRGDLDLVVSNPPYLAERELADLEPVVRDFDPVEALVAGPTGLEAVEVILSGAPDWLAPGAPVVIEIAPHQSDAVVRLATSVGLVGAQVDQDLAGRDRVLVAYAPGGAAAIAPAVAAVRRGEVIGLPTDTVYGIGADPFSETAARRLFEAKARPEHVALPVLVGDPEDAVELAEFDGRARRLAERYWPGALTIVLPRKSGAPPLHLGGDPETVGLRCPAHPVARELLRATGPLAVTSANLHGDRPALTAGELRVALAGQVEVIVDGGPCRGRPSTVVSLLGPGPVILRAGSITAAEIKRACAEGSAPGPRGAAG
jgi:release factor-specific protein-(glutamine-N5) methyltransferase/tRNA threonylcarbamoyl adenosine modification protein (Sua5/YciO/YrdC/YwlC family)